MNLRKLLSIITALVLVFALAGCGKNAADAPKENVISVSDIDGLIDAIGSDRCIELKSGSYDLTKASTYGRTTENGFCYWRELWSGDCELVIKGAENLTIEGSNSSIVTVPRSASVLTLEDCSMINLQHLVVGHTYAAEACEGAVLTLEDCSDISLFSCALYGCGTVGVFSERTNNIYLRDSDIYSCSYSAIEAYGGKGLTVINCDIHDLGQSGLYSDAYSVFELNSYADVDMQQCRVHDCYASMFITGSGINNAVFTGMNVYSNHFSRVFDVDGGIAFNGLLFSSNSFDKWFSDYVRAGTVSIDGERCSEDVLNEKFPGELSSAGVGTVAVEEQSIEFTGCEKVHVSTPDEFLDAIAPDTIICLDNDIDLTEAKSYGKGAENYPEWSLPGGAMFAERSYVWLPCYDGCALYIGCLDNFHIEGPGQIVTKTTYADVLSFYNCTNISLGSLTLGHDAEPGSCTGGVVELSLCENVIIESCDMYGCGTLGIEAENCNSVYVQNSRIHDCSYGGVQFLECMDVAFIGTVIENCPEPGYCLVSCINFSVDGTLMAKDCSF